MKLQNKLYSIIASEVVDNRATYTIILHVECEIYKAHFPGMPITPGVCIFQMAKELLEEATDKKLKIEIVKNAKFLSVMIPEGQNVIVKLANIRETDQRISAQVLVSAEDDSIYAKISLQAIAA